MTRRRSRRKRRGIYGRPPGLGTRSLPRTRPCPLTTRPRPLTMTAAAMAAAAREEATAAAAVIGWRYRKFRRQVLAPAPPFQLNSSSIELFWRDKHERLHAQSQHLPAGTACVSTLSVLQVFGEGGEEEVEGESCAFLLGCWVRRSLSGTWYPRHDVSLCIVALSLTHDQTYCINEYTSLG